MINTKYFKVLMFFCLCLCQMERTNLTEEILRVLQQLNVGVGGGRDALTEGDVRAIASQLVQREVTGLQDRITEQAKAKVSPSDRHTLIAMLV